MNEARLLSKDARISTFYLDRQRSEMDMGHQIGPGRRGVEPIAEQIETAWTWQKDSDVRALRPRPAMPQGLGDWQRIEKGAPIGHRATLPGRAVASR